METKCRKYQQTVYQRKRFAEGLYEVDFFSTKIDYISTSTMSKMPVHQVFRRSRDKLISVIYEGRPANDETAKSGWLKIAICALGHWAKETSCAYGKRKLTRAIVSHLDGLTFKHNFAPCDNMRNVLTDTHAAYGLMMSGLFSDGARAVLVVWGFAMIGHTRRLGTVCIFLIYHSGTPSVGPSGWSVACSAGKLIQGHFQ